VIRDVRRGRDLASLVVTATDGRALHVQIYGFTEDEARRSREELIRWFAATGIPLVDDEGRPL
jgi:ribosomal protein S3AE